MIKHTVYKTTNLLNGRFYIGAHSTEDPNDEYLGSGYLLNIAIEKYGTSNFKKEVLFLLPTLEEMYLKEKEVLSPYLGSPLCYNIIPGGWQPKSRLGSKVSEETKRKLSKLTSGVNNPFFGKKHTEEFRKTRSIKYSLPDSHLFGNKHRLGSTHSIATKQSMKVPQIKGRHTRFHEGKFDDCLKCKVYLEKPGVQF